MIGNPRHGMVGLLALPYFFIFEAAAPLLEAFGWIVNGLGLAFGLLDVEFAQLFLLTAVVYGTLISVTSVLLHEVSFRRYRRLSDLLMLAVVAVGENFGYRQLTVWWRLRGTFDFFLNRGGWGEMTRKGFTSK